MGDYAKSTPTLVIPPSHEISCEGLVEPKGAANKNWNCDSAKSLLSEFCFDFIDSNNENDSLIHNRTCALEDEATSHPAAILASPVNTKLHDLQSIQVL